METLNTDERGSEWNTAVVLLAPGEQPQFQCNGHSKAVSESKRQTSYDLSGLANFGSSMSSGVSGPGHILLLIIKFIDDEPIIGLHFS